MLPGSFEEWIWTCDGLPRSSKASTALVFLTNLFCLIFSFIRGPLNSINVLWPKPYHVNRTAPKVRIHWAGTLLGWRQLAWEILVLMVLVRKLMLLRGKWTVLTLRHRTGRWCSSQWWWAYPRNITNVSGNLCKTMFCQHPRVLLEDTHRQLLFH